ncbi:HD domain-containing protein [Desulfallas thermosapovorans]|uniref:Putative nucleotidyltransferase with HDIG domain n=1 Tax=Desulfallas thermosapovorans DSM 6562 TaxID=1121431 RepID=A0A5S4ZQA2_9FIRM|nr:HD domain-containing protein [Desulfallas thermosapovorans]TYO94864.1 putative nucleotidyltransferase with HDIG domain [Desulfallas thermosapovorans DSM 6562]
MTREEAYKLLKQHLKNKNLIKHSLAVEAVMRRLAEHFNEDVEKWGLAGLLHDIDYDRTKDDPHRHSLEGADLLADKGLPGDVVYAVRVHNEAHGLPRKTLMDKALYSTDPLTGLIVAGALVRPEKKLSAVDVTFLKKKYGEKAFARGANREIIAACSEMGLELEEFLALGLEAMQGIAGEMGL